MLLTLIHYSIIKHLPANKSIKSICSITNWTLSIFIIHPESHNAIHCPLINSEYTYFTPFWRQCYVAIVIHNHMKSSIGKPSCCSFSLPIDYLVIWYKNNHLSIIIKDLLGVMCPSDIVVEALYNIRMAGGDLLTRS